LSEVTVDQLGALVAPAERVARTLIGRREDAAPRQLGRILARADALVEEMRAGSGIERSDLLQSSLTSRLAALGEELRRATARSTTKAVATSVDAPLVEAEALRRVEDALSRV